MDKQKQSNEAEQIETRESESANVVDDRYHWPKDLLALLKGLFLVSLFFVVLLGLKMGFIQRTLGKIETYFLEKKAPAIVEQHFLDNYGIEVEAVSAQATYYIPWGAQSEKEFKVIVRVMAEYEDEYIHSTVYNKGEAVFDDYENYLHKKAVVQYVVESLGLPEPQKEEVLPFSYEASSFQCTCDKQISKYCKREEGSNTQTLPPKEEWDAIAYFEKNGRNYRFFYDGEVELPEDLSQRMAKLYLPLQEDNLERDEPYVIEFVFLKEGHIDQLSDLTQYVEEYLPYADSIVRYWNDGEYLPKEIVE